MYTYHRLYCIHIPIFLFINKKHRLHIGAPCNPYEISPHAFAKNGRLFPDIKYWLTLRFITLKVILRIIIYARTHRSGPVWRTAVPMIGQGEDYRIAQRAAKSCNICVCAHNLIKRSPCTMHFINNYFRFFLLLFFVHRTTDRLTNRMDYLKVYIGIFFLFNGRWEKLTHKIANSETFDWIHWRQRVCFVRHSDPLSPNARKK